MSADVMKINDDRNRSDLWHPELVFRVSLDLEKSALANLKEEMKQAQLKQGVCVISMKLRGKSS